jgi:transposase
MTEPAVSVESAMPVLRSRRDPAATRQRWVERLQRFQASHLTVAQFCLAEGVSVPAFYQQRRLLAAESSTEPSGRPTVVPVRIAQPTPAVEVVLPSGALIRFSADCDPERVAAVLRAVGAVPC